MEHISMLVLIKELLAWRTIVDILLIATGIFFLYQTLRRLGTWKIVVGILAFVGIFLLAQLLDLKGIRWIYSNLSNVIIIALIVIFQPELRKIFERAVLVGRTRTPDPGEELSLMVAEALFTMAKQKRGAIVVFPGKEPITEFVFGGFPLDAKPSGPLLMSIFDPNSPGHDGAIIITMGQFAKFGVRLPVSESSTLPQEYGTRHHAAMGLAEKTDALVIVASEERGKISTFHMGQMKRVGRVEDLVKTIVLHWNSTSSFPFEFTKGESRRSFFFQMATSLALAMFFWSTIIVAQGEKVERVFTVPVEYSVTPANIALVGERKKDVQLYLGGEKSDMDELNPSNLSIKIDLSQVEPGTQFFYITNDHIRLPNGIELLDVIPSSLELTLAALTEQWASVTPQLVGELPAGLKISSIDVKPEKVNIISASPEGSENGISVMTTPIYLESITKNTRILCKIITPQTIQPVEKRWPDVEVNIRIKN